MSVNLNLKVYHNALHNHFLNIKIDQNSPEKKPKNSKRNDDLRLHIYCIMYGRATLNSQDCGYRMET